MAKDDRLLIHGFQAGYSLGRLRFEHLCIFPDPEKINPQDPPFDEHVLDMISLLRVSASHLLRSMAEGTGASYLAALDPLLSEATTQWGAFHTGAELSTLRKAIEGQLAGSKTSERLPSPDATVKHQLDALFKELPSAPHGPRISHNSATERLVVACQFEARSPVLSVIKALENLLTRVLENCSSNVRGAFWLGFGVGGLYRKLIGETHVPSGEIEELKTIACGVLREDRKRSAAGLFVGVTGPSKVTGRPKLYNLFRPINKLRGLLVDEFTEMAKSAGPVGPVVDTRFSGPFEVEVDGDRGEVFCSGERLDLDADAFRLVDFVAGVPQVDCVPRAIKDEGKVQNPSKALKRFEDACEKIGVDPRRLLTHIRRKTYRWEPEAKRKDLRRPRIKKFRVPPPPE